MRDKTELINEAIALGIPLKDIEYLTKEGIMDVLAKKYIAAHPEIKPLPQLPCMLAKPTRHLKESKFEQLLDNDHYYYEIKKDGCRGKLHIGKTKNRIDSRHRSDVSYLYVEKTDNFPWIRDAVCDTYAGTVIDFEFQSTAEKLSHNKTQTVDFLSSSCAIYNSGPEASIELQNLFGKGKFIVFDTLFYKGKDIRALNFVERREFTEAIVEWLKATGMPNLELSPVYRASAWDAKKLFAAHSDPHKGEEGLMLKHSNSSYSITENSRTMAMYKWKKDTTIDCFITGYVPGQKGFEGLIGGVIFGVIDPKTLEPIEIGSANPGDMTIRQAMSDEHGGLKQQYYYDVVEVGFQEWTKNNRLRHPVIIRFRPDKNWKDCYYMRTPAPRFDVSRNIEAHIQY